MISASIDLETGGLTEGLHEPLSIAVVCFDETTFKPNGLTFRSLMKPMRPELVTKEALAKNNLSMDELMKAPSPASVRHSFLLWKEEVFDFGAQIFPLGFNYQFDQRFLSVWMGREQYNQHFYYKYRDTFILAQAVNDSGLAKFDKMSLVALSERLSIDNKNAHTAYGDAICALECYSKLLDVIKIKMQIGRTGIC